MWTVLTRLEAEQTRCDHQPSSARGPRHFEAPCRSFPSRRSGTATTWKRSGSLWKDKGEAVFKGYLRYYLSDHRPMWVELRPR